MFRIFVFFILSAFLSTPLLADEPTPPAKEATPAAGHAKKDTTEGEAPKEARATAPEEEEKPKPDPIETAKAVEGILDTDTSDSLEKLSPELNETLSEIETGNGEDLDAIREKLDEQLGKRPDLTNKLIARYLAEKRPELLAAQFGQMERAGKVNGEFEKALAAEATKAIARMNQKYGEKYAQLLAGKSYTSPGVTALRMAAWERGLASGDKKAEAAVATDMAKFLRTSGQRTELAKQLAQMKRDGIGEPLTSRLSEGVNLSIGNRANGRASGRQALVTSASQNTGPKSDFERAFASQWAEEKKGIERYKQLRDTAIKNGEGSDQARAALMKEFQLSVDGASAVGDRAGIWLAGYDPEKKVWSYQSRVDLAKDPTGSNRKQFTAKSPTTLDAAFNRSQNESGPGDLVSILENYRQAQVEQKYQEELTRLQQEAKPSFVLTAEGQQQELAKKARRLAEAQTQTTDLDATIPLDTEIAEIVRDARQTMPATQNFATVPTASTRSRTIASEPTVLPTVNVTGGTVNFYMTPKR